MPEDSVFHVPHSPIAVLGTLTLLVAFVVCAYAAAAGVIGHRRGRPGLVASSVYASWAFTALMCFASALIVYAFLAHDFRIKYVAHYSDTTMPLFYQITAYWGGLDGSMMFWVFVLSIFSAAALLVNRRRHHDMIGYVVAVVSATSLFFLALLLYQKNPFTTFLTTPPAQGKGLNPLLQNYWMVIHPPSLYTGYVGMTIPFAFCVAALASGRLDDGWLYSVRVWVLIPWFFLSLGLVLGGLWAYEELGWGGYWAWDPVENAGLIPWFTATAFLHSIMIQERRGMLKVWNIVLMIVTFWLTIFGTFMTRSGVVQSVHAFGQDNELAMLFLLFLTTMLVISVGLLLYRLPALRSAASYDSFWSREFAFLLNNWILLMMAFFVLFATMFPTLSQYLMDHRVTVGPPFFNRWMTPLGLVLLALTGIGPLLAWRHTTEKRLIDQFMIPTILGVGTTVLFALTMPRTRVLTPLFSGHLRMPVVLYTLGAIAFVLGSIGQEFIRGALVRSRQTGSDPFTALIGVMFSKRRKFGGYLVHIGIAIMFLGFVGRQYQRTKSVTLDHAGETFTLDDYTFRYDDLDITGNDNRDMFTAKIAILKDNKVVGHAVPARWHYKTGEEQTTTEVHIDRNLDKDIYIVLNGFDGSSKQAAFSVFLNPLVNFVWMGFGWLFLGFILCVFPQAVVNVLKPARTKIGAAAQVAASLLVFFGIGLGMTRLARGQELPAPGGAQGPKHMEMSDAKEENYPPIAQRIFDNIVCMCGDCTRQSIGECKCTQAAAERQKILGMIQGKDVSTKEAADAVYNEVIQTYIARYGGEHVLMVPRNKGFNVVAWALPYAAIGGALVMVVFLGRNWINRKPPGPPPPTGGASAGATPPPSEDPEYADKLDDELDDLD
jgi:cytochrome c-type biogenesis protein CcmF